MAAFYTAPTCSPTRAMLMTGIDSHRVGLGTMAELFAPAQRGRPGYEGFLLPSAATLAENLHAAGYRTLMSGKWHLGPADRKRVVVGKSVSGRVELGGRRSIKKKK